MLIRELLEKEMSSTKGEMMKKDVEFSQAAECLERELNSLRTQLHSMQDEKQNILRDKENLLEEVSTHDTAMTLHRRHKLMCLISLVCKRTVSVVSW